MPQKLWVPLAILALLCLPLTAFAADNGGGAQTKALTLVDCLKTGYDNSQDIKKAAKSVDVAWEGVKQAAGGFFPTLKYSLGYEKDSYNTVNYVPVDKSGTYWTWKEIDSGDQAFSGALTLSWTLYDGGKLTGNLKVAWLDLDSAKEDLRSAKQELTYNIKAYFYALWLAEQQLKVAQASYDNLQQHYEQVKKQFEVEKKAKYDLLKAEVAWKEEEPTLLSAKNSVKTAKLNLATAIGLGKQADVEISYGDAILQIPAQPEMNFQSLLDEAYQQRPEIRQSEQNIKISKWNRVIARAGYLPSLTLSGTSSNEGATSDYKEWDDKTWTLSVGMSGLIFDGPTTLSKIKEAKLNEQIATIKDTQERDTVRKDVQSAIQNIQQYYASVGVNQDNVALDQEALRMTQIKFDAGMATTLDVKDAQLSLDEAGDDYYQEIANYLNALAKLDYVLGKD
jgi:outer membrane protein